MNIPDLLPGRATNASTGQQDKSESKNSQQDGSDNAENDDQEEEHSETYGFVQGVDFPEFARPEMFYGLTGELVELMCDGTELLPEAVAAQFLCIFGGMLGRGPYKEQDKRHGTLVNVAIVGNTSDGAKGSSLNAVKKLIKAVDVDFWKERITGGHNSSEAILEQVADEVTKETKKGIEVVVEGVDDKRLVIVEEELSRIFQSGKRNGNTTSEILRQCYDYPDELRALSRTSPLKSTEPTISIIGHITREGLKSTMPDAEAFNGFANRFTFIASKRTCSIPEPPNIDWYSGHGKDLASDLRSILNRFHPGPISSCNQEVEFKFSGDGRLKWTEVYHRLSASGDGKSGMHGAVTARGRSTVIRFAIIYAALDGSTIIQPEHIDAAMALWEYSLRSALWAFGENSGNWRADKIVVFLKRRGKRGARRTELAEEVFNKRISSSDLTEALAYLKNSGLAYFTKKGRTETWYSLSRGTN
jgi:Protein of unknown function (DUF3987)